MTDQYEEDEPLDPTLERVRKKMIRLLVISIGIMVIGLMAVFGAIVYKIGNSDNTAESAAEAKAPSADEAGVTSTSKVALPDGSNLLTTEVVGERLLLKARLENEALLFVLVDLLTGEIVSRIEVSD